MTLGDGQWLRPFLAPQVDAHRTLSGNHARAAYSLRQNVQLFLDRYPIEAFLFETLTFAEKDISTKEANRRFSSFRRNRLTSDEINWLGILERSDPGRLHFHLLTHIKGKDFRTGFDWETALAYQRASRFKASRRELDRLTAIFSRSATPDLRQRWADMSAWAPAYGFGRTESRPVRSNSEALGLYLCKYIEKHIGHRIEADKGARMVLASASTRRCTQRIAWNSPGAKRWREKIQELSGLLMLPSFSELFYAFLEQNGHSPEGIDKSAEAADFMSGPHFWLGHRWAFSLYNLLTNAEDFDTYEHSPMGLSADDLRTLRTTKDLRTMDLCPPGQQDLSLQGVFAKPTKPLPLYGAAAN